MPIISIISQPSTSELKAAYRPIVFVVRATRTDDDPRPPVVYCDIYINNVFYKTQAKTQYTVLNTDDSDWQFDIQDACQEVLGKKLAANPMSEILPVPEVMKSISCKFRSSGINAEGFITPEGTAPIQGTGSNAPIAGTGTDSNSFYIVNATLQHDQNQNLAAHLNTHKKNGLWATTTYPLSHRPNGYKISHSDADVFPIIHLGNFLKCLVLKYRFKGQTIFQTAESCFPLPCNIIVEDIAIEISQQAPDVIYVIYHATWTVTGDPLFGYTKEFSVDGGLTWEEIIEITVFDSTQIYYGLGSGTINETPRDHLIRITPIPGPDILACTASIGIYDFTPCDPVAITGTPVLPDGVVGTPYSYSFSVTGTAPFTLPSLAKPSWMTISVVGSTIEFSGTPDAEGTGISVTLNISNCTSDTINFSDTIDVTEEIIGGTISIEDCSNGNQISAMRFNGVIITVSGGYPISEGESRGATVGIPALAGTFEVDITGHTGGTDSRIEIVDSNGNPSCLPIDSNDTFTFLFVDIVDELPFTVEIICGGVCE